MTPNSSARRADKIYVDIEPDELAKDIVPVDHKITVPLHQFFGAML
jgi:hypothetical protein